MKNKKILIPLMSTLALGTTIVPMIAMTSCGGKKQKELEGTMTQKGTGVFAYDFKGIDKDVNVKLTATAYAGFTLTSLNEITVSFTDGHGQWPQLGGNEILLVLPSPEGSINVPLTYENLSYKGQITASSLEIEKNSEIYIQFTSNAAYSIELTTELNFYVN